MRDSSSVGCCQIKFTVLYGLASLACVAVLSAMVDGNTSPMNRFRYHIVNFISINFILC